MGSGRVGRVAAGLMAAATALALTGCTAGQRQGQSASLLVIDSLQAASGAKPGTFGTTLDSDVVTVVKSVPTIFDDPGSVSFRLVMKNQNPDSPGSTPSDLNAITINRYHVSFVRTDGRNTPGVDVPYPFDGAFTTTVSASNTATAGFTLVRIQAKEEAPLNLLAAGGGAKAISTIAQVTFYGTDQAGREVSASGNIGVTFADWGDPDSGSSSNNDDSNN
jgi:hypothetical protein